MQANACFEPDEFYDRRGAERQRASMELGFWRHGGTWTKVDLLDISATGCRLKSMFSMETSSTILLQLPSLAPLRALIIRYDGSEAALHFEQPLHPAVLKHLIKQHGDQSSEAA